MERDDLGWQTHNNNTQKMCDRIVHLTPIFLLTNGTPINAGKKKRKRKNDLKKTERKTQKKGTGKLYIYVCVHTYIFFFLNVSIKKDKERL